MTSLHSTYLDAKPEKCTTTENPVWIITAVLVWLPYPKPNTNPNPKRSRKKM